MEKDDKYKSRLNYNNSYNRNNYKSFSFRFSIKEESDIISWLENKDGIKAYLTSLIREDMARSEN